MRAPEFWGSKQDSLASLSLTPFSWLYRAGIALADAARPAPLQAPVPVICIGNVTVGGTGKTPIAIDVAERLKIHKMAPHFLTRGYGGKIAGPIRVKPETHSAKDIGDEALLLARIAPTWVGANRAVSAMLAFQAGAGCLVMDDGFQNFTLEKDLSFLVFDGNFGVGNGRILPAGPMRETIKTAIPRSDGVIIMGADLTGTLSKLISSVPKFSASLKPILSELKINDLRVFAFAGIGRPEKFFETLSENGVTIVDTATFPDHYSYSSNDIAELKTRAKSLDASLITTEKDAVRLPSYELAGISTLEITVKWDDEAAFDLLLSRVINRNKHDN